MKDTIKGLFNGSFNQMVSSFVKNKELSITELEEVREMLEMEIKKQNKTSL